MTKKYFPINTATSCQLKWNWSTIVLTDGTTSSCHRVKGSSLTPQTFDDFHNTPKKLADRELMLQGQWPTGGCEYCKNIEQVGGFSDRMLHLSIPNMTPPELEIDSTATKITPSIVEVYFDNLCNMKCVYCYDGFSSQIQTENIKFGRFEKDGVVIDNFSKMRSDREQLTESFWLWMQQHHADIKRLQVLGGEPLIQKHFDHCLNFFDNNPSPNLELNIVTNLKVSKEKLKTIIATIKRLLLKRKIKRFDITASIDCFGPEQEYVRNGINVEQWKDNFKLIAAHPWITLNINQALSSLTIKTVPEMLQFINQTRATRKIGHYFSTTVSTHDFLHPRIFGPGFFAKDFEAILQHMPDTTWQDQQAKKYMSGIKSYLDVCSQDISEIKKLQVFLNEMDRRRNTNWKQTFPWLEQEIKKCGIVE